MPRVQNTRSKALSPGEGKTKNIRTGTVPGNYESLTTNSRGDRYLCPIMRNTSA